MTAGVEVKQVKLPYIPHPLLQDGFGYFICEDKKCKQQILPQLDGYQKQIPIKVMVTLCRRCKREYTRSDLERLTKKKKILRAVKITM